MAKRIGLAAVMLSGMDDERVEFVEEVVIARERGFESGAEVLIGGFGMGEAVAFEDAAGVGIDDEDGMLAGIEEDGVGGFGADAAKSEKLFAEALGGGSEQAVERAAVLGEEKSNEGLESLGFLAEVARRAEASGKSCWTDATDYDG